MIRDIKKTIRLKETVDKAYSALDLYDKQLAFKPNRLGDSCVFCGRRATSRHHVIPRSRLSKVVANVISPLFAVCGTGNEGDSCHGKLHSGRLFVRWNKTNYEYLKSDVPISRDEAHAQDGWVRMGGVL
jgi:hypothetical protein